MTTLGHYRIGRPPIDMTAARIPGFQVLDQAPTPPNLRHACWWLRCDACGEQRWETGSTLRRAARGTFTVWCRHCGDRPA